MEQIYNDLIKNIILQYLDANVDSELFNIENLTRRVTKEYMEDFPFNDFMREIEEQIADVLEQKLRVCVNF